MTKVELEKLAEELHQDSMNLMGLKNNDYTCGKAEEDALYNFHFIAKVLDVDPKLVWGVYFLKHVLATLKYIKSGYVESEGIKGRLMDIHNYNTLLWAIMNEEQKENLTQKE